MYRGNCSKIVGVSKGSIAKSHCADDVPTFVVHGNCANFGATSMHGSYAVLETAHSVVLHKAFQLKKPRK